MSATCLGKDILVDIDSHYLLYLRYFKPRNTHGIAIYKFRGLQGV